MIRLLIGTICAVQVLAQVPPPVWPQVFTQAFVESYTSTHLHVTGKVHYDSAR